VWDDHTLIVDRLAQLDAAGIAALWTHPVGGGQAGGGYFRPLAVTLLAVLGRHGVFAIHLAIAGLHAVSAGLVCALSGRDRLALLGAALFAVHPLCAEVLGWASALPDALSVALGLTALHLARRSRHIVVVVTVFVLSVLSKEAGIVWPVVGFVAGWLDRRSSLAAGLAVALVLALRPLLGVEAAALVSLDPSELLGAPLSQLGTLLWPLPLSAVRDTHHLGMLGVELGALVVAAVLFAAGHFRRPLAGPALGLLAGPCLALPTVLTSHLAADRYVYLSVACLGLLVGTFPRSVKLRRRLAARSTVWGGGVLVVLVASVHVDAAEMWRSDVALFERAVEVRPSSSYSHYFAGHAQAKAGDFHLAADHFEAASSLSHAHPRAAGFALQAMVRAGEATRAVDFARSRPKDGLTAEWIAWWAQAELDAGHAQQAQSLVVKLRRDDGSWDGPPFVPDLAEQARQQAQSSGGSGD